MNMTDSKRRSLKYLAGCACGIGLVLLQLRGAPQDDAFVFTSDASLVTLHVSVLDKNGKPVTNLPQSSFKVYEDNVEQPLKIFKREDVPVSMGILLDNSGSMREKRSRVAAAAIALVKASNPDDEEFIVNFNDDSFFDQPFTSDIKKLESALAKLNPRGGTAMRNAISTSIDYLRTDAKLEKKVLVVVTDGNDNSSTETSLDQLIRKVQGSETLVYTIGLLNEEEPDEAKKARKALKALAEASGGFDYYPKDLAEVEAITPQIAHEIRNQYILAYTPLNLTMDGKFRSIRVEVKGYGKVRAKNGYYAKSASAKK
jgi:Ca-activated chloride channel family protein